MNFINFKFVIFVFLLIFKIITMKKHSILLGVCTIGLLFSCATNPITGKKTLNFVSNSELFPSSFQEYGTFLKENKIISGTADANMVAKVGARIKLAAEKYVAYVGQPEYLKDYRWEYNLVESKDVNAWCMPGGKIVVYSGILPITKDEAGLATVIGHEVSHALANHGAQRMSASQLQGLGAVGVAVATGGKSEQAQQTWQQIYGVGSEVGVMLPYSRGHETEADKIGLTLMAIAGYNPDESIAFWMRMSANSQGQAPPPFLSSHPSDATRIADLKKLIPEAKATAAKFGMIYK
jgi:predicted Zn-dependent protease